MDSGGSYTPGNKRAFFSLTETSSNGIKNPFVHLVAWWGVPGNNGTTGCCVVPAAGQEFEGGKKGREWGSATVQERQNLGLSA